MLGCLFGVNFFLIHVTFRDLCDAKMSKAIFPGFDPKQPRFSYEFNYFFSEFQNVRFTSYPSSLCRKLNSYEWNPCTFYGDVIHALAEQKTLLPYNSYSYYLLLSNKYHKCWIWCVGYSWFCWMWIGSWVLFSSLAK